MSKEVFGYPNNPELLIPSGTLTFNPDVETPFSISFRNDELENSVPIEYGDYRMQGLTKPEGSMPEHIDNLVESVFEEIDDDLLVIEDGREHLSVHWGIEPINCQSEEEIDDFVANELGEHSVPEFMGRFNDKVKANFILNKPTLIRNFKIDRLVDNLVASQYLFGVPRDKYSAESLVPSRILRFRYEGEPDIAIREPMQRWINESSEEEKSTIVEDVANYIRKIDGQYEDEDEPFFVKSMEIGGYGNVLFTGSCTYLGGYYELDVAKRFDQGKEPRLSSSDQPMRLMSDDLQTTTTKDMLHLEHRRPTCLAVIGAINKAALNSVKV